MNYVLPLLMEATSNSAFSSDQMTAITSAITGAVGAVIDTFVGVLPLIEVIRNS